jgi:hypothetical protein
MANHGRRSTFFIILQIGYYTMLDANRPHKMDSSSLAGSVMVSQATRGTMLELEHHAHKSKVLVLMRKLDSSTKWVAK